MTDEVKKEPLTDKQLEKLGHQRNLENIEKEIGLIQWSLDQQIDFKNRFLRKVEVAKAMHQIALNNFQRLTPNWAFEGLEEYLTLQKEMTDIDFKVNMLKSEQQIAQFDSQIATYTEQITSQVTAKKQVQNAIDALGE